METGQHVSSVQQDIDTLAIPVIFECVEVL